jgi:hypothetical protein
MAFNSKRAGTLIFENFWQVVLQFMSDNLRLALECDVYIASTKVNPLGH